MSGMRLVVTGLAVEGVMTEGIYRTQKSRRMSPTRREGPLQTYKR